MTLHDVGVSGCFENGVHVEGSNDSLQNIYIDQTYGPTGTYNDLTAPNSSIDAKVSELETDNATNTSVIEAVKGNDGDKAIKPFPTRTSRSRYAIHITSGATDNHFSEMHVTGCYSDSGIRVDADYNLLLDTEVICPTLQAIWRCQRRLTTTHQRGRHPKQFRKILISRRRNNPTAPYRAMHEA